MYAKAEARLRAEVLAALAASGMSARERKSIAFNLCVEAMGGGGHASGAGLRAWVGPAHHTARRTVPHGLQGLCAVDVHRALSVVSAARERSCHTGACVCP